MQIELKELEYCKLQVSCSAGEEEIEKKRSEVLKVFKNVSIPGFRKGKATVQAIKKYYKKQIEESLKRALAEEAFHQSIFENGIKPLGNPQFTELYLQPNNFSCEFVIHNKPTFDLMDLSSIEIPKPHQAMSEEDYTQKRLQELRVENGERKPFEENDFVQEGDVVTVSYEAYVDGEKKDNLSTEGELITVGSSKIQKFDENLIGLKPGDVKEFNVDVSEKSSSEFANKTITFKLTMHMGMKVIPAALDDNLAKKLGKESFDQLSQDVRFEAAKMLEAQSKNALQQAIISRLVFGHDFQVPEWLGLTEAQYLASAAKLDWNVLDDKVKEAYVSQAVKNVKLSLILDKIRENEPEAQLTDHEVMDMLRNNMKMGPVNNVEDTLKELNKLGYLPVLYNRIRDEYTLDFVTKSVKIIE